MTLVQHDPSPVDIKEIRVTLGGESNHILLFLFEWLGSLRLPLDTDRLAVEELGQRCCNSKEKTSRRLARW